MLVHKDIVNLARKRATTVALRVTHPQMMEFPARTEPIFDQLLSQLDALDRKCEQLAADLSQVVRNTTPSMQDDFTSTAGSGDTSPNSIALRPRSLSENTRSSHAAQPTVEYTFLSTVLENSPPSMPCHKLRPHQPSPLFVGRREVIDKIKQALYPGIIPQQRSFLLHGLGGMGKTQTALQFIFESTSMFRSILWARAEDKTKLSQDFAEYAKELGLVKTLGKDLDYPVDTLLRWYESTKEPWLVVFDGLDIPDTTELRKALRDFWPRGSAGAVLVTSRNRELMGTYTEDAECLNVLDKESSIELLMKLIPDPVKEDRQDLEKVVRQVDYLPLGILAAASFIRNDSLSARDFLETYSNSDMIQDANAHSIDNAASRYRHTLATTWDLEFGKLETKAKAFLFLLAFLDADKVQERLLSEGARKANFPALHFLSNPKSFNVCRALVTRSSLVTRNKDTRQIWMHRLVKENCHFRMSPSERQNAFQGAVHLLITELPDREVHERWNLALWPHVREHLAHVVSLSRYYMDSKSNDSPHTALQADSHFVRLLFNAGW